VLETGAAPPNENPVTPAAAMGAGAEPPNENPAPPAAAMEAPGMAEGAAEGVPSRPPKVMAGVGEEGVSDVRRFSFLAEPFLSCLERSLRAASSREGGAVVSPAGSGAGVPNVKPPAVEGAEAAATEGSAKRAACSVFESDGTSPKFNVNAPPSHCSTCLGAAQQLSLARENFGLMPRRMGSFGFGSAAGITPSLPSWAASRLCLEK